MQLRLLVFIALVCCCCFWTSSTVRAAEVSPCPSACSCNSSDVICERVNAVELGELFEQLSIASGGIPIGSLALRRCNGAIGQLKNMPTTLRVRSLEVSMCGVTSIDDALIAHLANDLTELRLSGNNLTNVPSLGVLSNLQVLNLNNNQLTTLGEQCFNGLNKLVQLRVKKNKICRLPQNSLDELKPQLELLDLSYNCFTEVPAKNLRNFRTLKHLDLSENQISSLRELEFMNLPMLKEVRLSGNRVTAFSPRAFVNVPSLSHLFLRGNALTDIDASILQNFKLLEAVDLSKNLLTKIPTFKDLPQLKTVNLDNNAISRINTLTFSNNPKLSSISIRNNRLSLIARNSFDGLSSLNNLILSNNQLKALDGGIMDGMPNLQILVLKNNTIADLSNSSLSSVAELTLLDMANNQLTTIHPSTFVYQRKLYWLDLSNNHISSIQRGAFNGAVGNILLDGNQLQCDNAIDWFITYLVTNNIRTFLPNQSEVVCAGPEKFVGVRLKDLMIKKANETLTTSMQQLGNGLGGGGGGGIGDQLQRNNFLASLLPALSGMGGGGGGAGGGLLGALTQAVPTLRNLPGWGGMLNAPGGAGGEGGALGVGKGFESAIEQFAEPLVRFSTGAQPSASDVSSLIQSIPNLIVNLPGYGNIDVGRVNPKLLEHVLKGNTIPGIPKEAMDSVVRQVMYRVYASAAHAQGQPIDANVASTLPRTGIDYKKYLRPLNELPEGFVTNVMKGDPLPFLTPSQTEVVKEYYTQSVPLEAINNGTGSANMSALANPGMLRMFQLLPPGYNISRIPPDVIKAAMRGEVPDLTRLPSDLQNYLKDNWEKVFNKFDNTPDVSVDEILKKLPKFEQVSLTTFAPYDINEVDSDLVVRNSESNQQDIRLYVAIALGLVSAATLAILIGFCLYVRKSRVPPVYEG